MSRDEKLKKIAELAQECCDGATDEQIDAELDAAIASLEARKTTQEDGKPVVGFALIPALVVGLLVKEIIK